MAEVIGAIASVIGILTATIHAYDKVQGVRDLPEAFLEVGDKLPLVIATLEKIKADAGRLPSGAQDDVNKVIGSCAEKARKLQLLLAKLRLDGSKPFDLKSYVHIIKGWGRMWGKNGRVEDLVKKIMDDVTLLAQSHAVNAVDQDLITNLQEAIENLDRVTPSAPDEMLEAPGGSGVSHGGIGDQFNFGDNTNSNFNTGPGTFQLGGTYYSGPDPEEACKEALGSLITDPEADKRRIEGLKGGLQSEVFQWILETSEFKQWQSDPERRLLWIKGDPGKGKTMLICGIINTLREATSHTPIAFFFLQAADQRINNAISLLLCLIYRLIALFPPVIRHFRKRYDYYKDQLFQGPNAWYSLEEIMHNIFQDPDVRNVILIIDGLDECVHNRKELLHLINQASSQHTHIKWIVSSRNWLDIEQGLHSATRLSLELNEKSVSTAVELFVARKVRSLAESLSEEGLQRITTKLLAKAQGTFLWVALVCQELSSQLYFPDSLEAAIEDTPPGLNALYSRMMDSISRSKERERIEMLLATNLAAYRPLALPELASLVPSSWNLEQDTGRLQKLIQLCGSFLTVTAATVSWVHQSARDYLLETFFGEPATRRAAHWVICQGSLESMLSATLRRDIYGLTKHHGPLASSGIGVKGFEEMRPSPDPLASIAYSCIYWAKHLEGSDVSDDTRKRETVRTKVKSFLETRFIYWLEALSILRHVTEGVQSMQTLLFFVENTEPLDKKASELLDLVQDMRRFLLVFRPCIMQCPLQVYTSGLLLSPDKKSVRNLFFKDLPKWISLKTLILSGEEKPKATEKGSSSKSTNCVSSTWAPIRFTFPLSWSSWLQTLDFGGNATPSLEYSPDSLRLASWASSSGRWTIKLWDAITGKMLCCLGSGVVRVKWVAFSPDSTKLFAVSDRNIFVWDATNLKQLQIINADNRDFLSAALCPRGLKLTLVSSRGTVAVWDLLKAELHKQFETLMNDICSVAFSPNRHHIAIRTTKNRIFQWNLLSAEKTREIGPWASVARRLLPLANDFCFAFTHDSNNLVVWRSFSFEVYNVATGRRCFLEQSFAVASSFAVDHRKAIFFSKCGLYMTLVGCYWSRKEWETRVYRLDNGQQQFNISSDSCGEIAMIPSPDGHQIAATSGTQIRLWSTQVDCGQEPNCQRVSVARSIFSPDCPRALVQTAMGETKVYDFSSGTELDLTSLDLWGEMALSCDGKMLATDSRDDSVIIWDLSGTHPRHRHRVGIHRVDGMVFSPNDQKLAASGLRFPHTDADKRNAILIADVTTGVVLNVHGHTPAPLYALAFSPDGDYLATNFHDEESWGVGRVPDPWVEIYCTVTGNCEYSARDRTALHTLTSNPTGGKNLFLIGPEGIERLGRDPSSRGFEVSEDLSWITFRGQRVVWLPPEFRPRRTWGGNEAGVAVYDSMVVSISSSALAFVFQFTKV